MSEQTQSVVSAAAQFEQKIKAIGICAQAEIPFLLVGPPGNAKTAVVESIFRQTCADYHVSVPALNDPAYYAGYPSQGQDEHEETIAVMLPNAWVRRLARIGAQGERVGTFLDEISSAPPATRAACLRGIMQGSWGDHSIPHSVCGAAMNPASMAESGYDLSPPLANRFVHFNWDPPVSWWDEQRMLGFPDPKLLLLPEDWEGKHLPQVNALHSAFARVKPGLVQACPDSAEARTHAWPSFRTWTWALRLLAASTSVGGPPGSDLALILVSAAVGSGAASEFLHYCQELDLPDPELLLNHPERIRSTLPERGDRAYACLTSVTSAVLANNTPDRWLTAWKVFEQAALMGKKDIAAISVKLLAKNKPDGVTETPKEVSPFVPFLRQAGLLGP